METIIAVASIIIAVVALVVAVWQGVITRRHNRLSVTPYLVVACMVKSRKPQIELSLANRGLGPALIRKIRVKIDGEYVSNNVDLWLEHLKTLDIPWEYSQVDFPHEGSFIAADSKQSLLVVEINNDNFNSLELYKQLKERFQIEIDYESIYGEEYKFI